MTLASFDDIPNEVLSEIFKHLTYNQQTSISRTGFLWNYLTQSMHSCELEQEFPFLITPKIQNAPAVEKLALIEKQKKIYEDFGRKWCWYRGDTRPIEFSYLRRERLESLYTNYYFAPHGLLDLLKILRVASSVIDNDPTVNKNAAFALMAGIGNLEKLRQWAEKDTGKLLSWDDAFYKAAFYGQLECLEYLLKNDRAKEISQLTKARALSRTVESGHSECMQLLIENEPSSPLDIEYAIGRVVRFGHLECLRYLVKKRKNKTIESFHNGRDTVLDDAIHGGHVACLRFLIKDSELTILESAITSAFITTRYCGRNDPAIRKKMSNCDQFLKETYPDIAAKFLEEERNEKSACRIL